MEGFRYFGSSKPAVTAAVLFFAVLFPVSALTRVVVPGVSYAGEIPLTEDQTDYVTYALQVPENAVGMKVTLSNSPADLDIFLGYGKEVENYEDAELFSVSEDYNETFFITRFSERPLKAGVYYLDIAYQREQFPVVEKKVLHSIPFSFKVEIFTEDIEKVLQPGRAAESTLVPREGMFRTFAVDVPAGAEALRIDLFDSNGDLDLLVKYGSYVRNYKDADFAVESLMTRESLVIRKRGPNALRPGRYFITVLDQVAAEYPISFKIIATFAASPPENLISIPPIPVARTIRERVLRSTVEIAGESGKGSGCIVSPGGYILTNWHVVRDFSGGPGKGLSVAVNLDDRIPPVELFRAEVVRYDPVRDFALLRITEGLYGQKLPEGYTFPYCLINWEAKPRIGDSIGFFGYPGIGGTGSRASITYTRGVVSGFEKTSFGTILKADGLINSGSSGGAAVDDSYRLIGLPTTIMEEDSGQLGFIHPVGMIPGDWRKLLGTPDD